MNAPTYQVTCNGQPLAGVYQVSYKPALAFHCGTFTLNKVFVPDDNFPAAFWAQAATKQIQIVISLTDNAPGGFAPVMTGNADSYAYNPIKKTLQIRGRDLAALMIDTLIVQTYRNQTASEIAQALAQEHGLSASVTATSTIVGQYYDVDHDQQQGGIFSRAVNEWDLLCLLGQKEGVIPYVFGNALYFNPAPEPPPYLDVWVDAAGNSNADDISFERNLTTARDVQVTVNSWNAKAKRLIKSAAYTKTVAQPAGNVASPPVSYTFEHDNLTQQQADALARQIALDISTHERVANVKLPGTSAITPQTALRYSGDGTEWCQIYFPSDVTTQLDFNGGYSTSISAKFSSPLGVYDGDAE